MKRLLALVFVIHTATTVVLAAEPESRLADALKKQDRTAARALLEQDADVNSPQVDGMTALHWAVYHDDIDMVRRLVAAGANVKAANRYGVTPLSVACENGNGVIVSRLLDAGADANAALRGGETALMTASRTGVLGPVQALLAGGAKVNAKERKGQTALMWAAAEGHVAVVDLLIKSGGDFRTPLKSGFTPWFFAVREGRTGVVRGLLAAGVDVNDVIQPTKADRKGPLAGTSALILAVENGHLDLAVALLKAGAYPKDQRCGFTALHAITWVRKPIRGDGDPPPVGSGNLSSLDFVRTLVASGADVNARHGKHNAGRHRLNRTGATPLLLASEAADVPLMRILVELGADPLLPNADNCTPLLAAAGVGVLSDGDEAAGTEEETIEAVKMLLKLGAKIDAVDDHGKTAMHGAAYKSRPKLVEVLAESGADIKIWNRASRRGVTPLQIAEGHRPGNFRPSPETIAVFHRLMLAAGITPPPPAPRQRKD